MALCSHPVVKAIARPLALLLVLQATLVFTERWLPVGVIFVATSEVPSRVCIVPTANLIVSTGFAGGFIVYFNLFCVRLSRVLISRQIKGRLWSLQMWHTASLPLILALRLLLIVGFGFATRAAKQNAESFLSGLLLSRFLVDLEYFVILFSVLLSVHTLVWRPVREVHTLRRLAPSMRILKVEAAVPSGATIGLDDISCDATRMSVGPIISRRAEHPRARRKLVASILSRRPPASAARSPHLQLSGPPAAERLECRGAGGTSAAPDSPRALEGDGAPGAATPAAGTGRSPARVGGAGAGAARSPPVPSAGLRVAVPRELPAAMAAQIVAGSPSKDFSPKMTKKTS